VGSPHPNYFQRGKFRVGHAYPNYSQGGHMTTLQPVAGAHGDGELAMPHVSGQVEVTLYKIYTFGMATQYPKFSNIT